LCETYWAAAKIGAVIVPLSTLLFEQAMKSLLQNSDSLLLITNSSLLI
jgi:acyl-coenzyme A synthetase/AMP-(fatty) acid ligase